MQVRSITTWATLRGHLVMWSYIRKENEWNLEGPHSKVAYKTIENMAQKSLPIGVYCLASLLMCIETEFNGCFPPKPLPKTLDDLNSVTKGAFTKTDDPLLCKTVCSSTPERLKQRVNSESCQLEH
jgi:hypothetical protein